MDNMTKDETSSESDLDIHIAVYILALVCVVWTILSNLFILWCFFRNKQRKWTNFSRQSCSMTIGDTLVGLAGIPFMIIEHGGRNVDISFCIATFGVMLSIQHVTLLHVLCICILRNIKIKKMTSASETSFVDIFTTITIAICWGAALIVIGLPFIIWTHGDDAQNLCYISAVFGTQRTKALRYIGSFYLAPQLLTNILYMVACYRMWSAIRKVVPVNVPTDLPLAESSNIRAETTDRQNVNTSMHNTGNVTSGALRMPMSQPLLSSLRNQRQVLYTIGILLLIFNVFTLPITFGMLFAGSNPANPNLRFLLTSFCILNSGLNPIVYAIRVPSLRNAVVTELRKILALFRL